MASTNEFQKADYGQLLYLLPFAIFLVLISLRDSGSFGNALEVLPVLGRTIPFFCLTLMLAAVFKYRGGSLKQLGLEWPNLNGNKSKVIIWILGWSIAIIAMRIFMSIAADPILELLPPKISRSSALAGNLTLLLSLLPLMWLIVVGEEVLMRGLLMNYLAKTFGDTKKAWMLAILISAIIFGIGHIGKGLAAVVSSGFGGLAYGLGYYFARKNLWPVIVAHCTVNTIGFIGAYFDG